MSEDQQPPKTSAELAERLQAIVQGEIDKATQPLIERIEQLEARVAELERQISR